ncbi:MAG TPA: hypothetical protein VGH19_04500 [Verrucomicrobiae bacterium]
MSAIDTIEHLRIGSFLGLPLYQPLGINPTSLVHRNPQDGHRLPKHLIMTDNVCAGVLVLGGGSGEHPAIVFHDPDHCVARYLEYCLHFDPPVPDPNLTAACANMQGDLQTIEYCDWTSADHLDFRERCAYQFRHYKDEISFEAWLLMSVGEFVFHTIPSYSDRIQGWRNQYAEQATCWFRNVLIPYDSYDGYGKNRFKILDTTLSTSSDDNRNG